MRLDLIISYCGISLVITW